MTNFILLRCQTIVYWIKLKFRLLALGILLVFSINSINELKAQCPTIFIDNMDGIPGYPAINDLSVCGVADTITYYVSNMLGVIGQLLS